MMPITMPKTYMMHMTQAALSGKNAAAKKAYIGNFAVQDMKGVSIMVRRRSRSEGRVRLAITAGTEQPKPISNGTMERPDSPNLRNDLSITKAMRAI